jgi:hypothetical protein
VRPNVAWSATAPRAIGCRAGSSPVEAMRQLDDVLLLNCRAFDCRARPSPSSPIEKEI